MFPAAARPFAAALAFACAPALAVERCELNSQSVNPSNGSTTAGKSGLMRCRDGDGGPVVREQELQNGVFMGVVRYFKDGELDAGGAVVRDDEVFEDGSRKAFGK
jgi:hypothetical protein